MTTRRSFLASLASLAAAAGLSRLAGGAEAPDPSPVVPKPAESRLTFCAQLANVSEFHRGKWLRPYRVVTFDERGHCVAVSRKRYVDARGRAVEVS